MKNIKYLLIIMMLVLLPIRIFADVSVSKTTINLDVGETETFTLSGTRVGGKFTVVSNDTSTATVTSPLLDDNQNVEDGLVSAITGGVKLWIDSSSSTPDTKTLKVTGVRSGTTTITVTAIDASDYSSGDEITFTRNISVTVNAATYKVTFGLEGGNAWTSSTCPSNKFTLSSSTCSKIITPGSIYGDLPTPTRSGYTFAGWNTKADGTGTTVTSSTTVNATSNYTLHAIWNRNGGSETPTTYVVTFGLNGGDTWTSTTCPSSKYNLNSSICTKTITVNSAYGDLPTPTRSGYTFASWNTKADGTGTTVTEETIVHASSYYTMYAIWTKNNDEEPTTETTYTLTYNSNGGTACAPATITVNSGEPWGTLCTPTYKGFKFNGWFTDKSGGNKITSSSVANMDLTAYAQWKKVTTPSNPKTGINPPIIALLLICIISALVFFFVKKKSNSQLN